MINTILSNIINDSTYNTLTILVMFTFLYAQILLR